MNTDVKKQSPWYFLGALLCFLVALSCFTLPFYSISYGAGKNKIVVAKASGIQVVMGEVTMLPPAPDAEKSDLIPPVPVSTFIRVLTFVAALSLIVGLVLLLLKRLIVCGSGVVAAVSLVCLLLIGSQAVYPPASPTEFAPADAAAILASITQPPPAAAVAAAAKNVASVTTTTTSIVGAASPLLSPIVSPLLSQVLPSLLTPLMPPDVAPAAIPAKKGFFFPPHYGWAVALLLSFGSVVLSFMFFWRRYQEQTNPEFKQVYSWLTEQRPEFNVGSIKYTGFGLLMVCMWLLWGDFIHALLDGSVFQILPLQLKDLGAKDITVQMLTKTFAYAVAFLLAPAVSFRSDRTRTRWGRRIPYLMWSTPFVGLFLVLLGCYEPLTNLVTGESDTAVIFGWSVGQGTISIFIIGSMMVLLDFANIFVNTVYYYLFNKT